MSKSSILLGSLATIVIIELSLFLYLNTEELKSYRKGAGLQNQFKASEKLGQMIVTAKTNDSRNIQVGEIVNEYSKKIDGDISIYYKDLTTDESIILEGDKKYYMASLYKIILTLFLLDEVENGNTTLDAQVGTSSATLNLALEKIITESNNEYAEILAEEYGWKTIETKMKEKLEVDFSFGEDLEASVKNIGILFENIALALNIEGSQSEYLLKLLQNQTLTLKLPKYLPSSVITHNKTGELENYSHDAGIFYTPKANYVLVFMSQTKDPKNTNEQMAMMSKEIYESLNELQK